MKNWGYVKDLLRAKEGIREQWLKDLHEECIVQHLQTLPEEKQASFMNKWVDTCVVGTYLACLEDQA